MREALEGDRPNYRFTVHAPPEFVSQIRESTLVGRWQYRRDYDPVQFVGLVSKLHDEVLSIVQAQGYFAPTIDIDDTSDQVTVRLNPGPRTRVSELSIDIKGDATHIRALRDVRRNLGMGVGDPFVSGTWQSGKTAIVAAMRRQGFLRARVTHSDARIDARTGKAVLKVDIDPGPRIAFGEVNIQGLERYPESVVDDLKTFSAGDPYDEEELQKFQTRLGETGYFNSASALPDLLSLQEHPTQMSVPINVIVDEAPQNRVTYGLGISTDDGVRGQLGFQDLNLFGMQMEAALVLSQRRQRAFTNFRTPYDANDRYYGFGGRVERETVNNLTSLKSNVYVGYGQRERDIDAFTFLQHQLESDTYRTTGARDSVKALVLGKAWSVQRFDSELNPSRGFGLKFEISGASRRLLSDQTFTRYYASAIGFRPLSDKGFWRNGALSARVELGVVNASSRDNIPSENLFFAGGTQSLRGYRYRSLGPTVDGAVVGQRYLAIGSLEYLHRITPIVSASLFYDYGNVASSWKSYSPVSGYGLGAQLTTPIGPVRLDLAYGQAVHRYRLHFSIGFSF
ncbi:MAG: autotransporter assembly complex family protein [Lautropia sp.]|nr:autotransporter assembly complex family protein [Lautropia sp.]